MRYACTTLLYTTASWPSINRSKIQLHASAVKCIYACRSRESLRCFPKSSYRVHGTGIKKGKVISKCLLISQHAYAYYSAARAFTRLSESRTRRRFAFPLEPHICTRYIIGGNNMQDDRAR